MACSCTLGCERRATSGLSQKTASWLYSLSVADAACLVVARLWRLPTLSAARTGPASQSCEAPGSAALTGRPPTPQTPARALAPCRSARFLQVKRRRANPGVTQRHRADVKR